MYNENQVMVQGGALGCYKDKDPMQHMTCGENLERKIAEQKERLATLFEALTSTKPNGAGLGLFSVRACAQGLGGAVEVEYAEPALRRCARSGP